jgi:hypothetical protein
MMNPHQTGRRDAGLENTGPGNAGPAGFSGAPGAGDHQDFDLTRLRWFITGFFPCSTGVRKVQG